MVNKSYTYDSSKIETKEKCPSCGKTWTSRLRAQASHFACSGCGYLFKISNKKKIKDAKFKELLIYPVLELGQKGIFDEIEYVVVGIVLLKDARESYYWYEYTLFHPLAGYKTLSHAEGHWNLFEKIFNYPKVRNSDPVKTVNHEGKWYDIFTRYSSLVMWAEGEFTYDITETPRPVITEWIQPPYILVREFGTSSIAWFKGRYMEPKEIKEAFDLSKELPPKRKVASNQPFSFGFNYDHFVHFSIAYLFAVIISIFLLSLVNGGQKKVFSKSYYPEYDSSSTLYKPFISESFQIEPGIFNTNGLDVELASGVDNNWFEAQITLINDDTDEEYELELGVEYYHGVTGGESWSEGSGVNSKFISEISPGKYHMVIIPFPNSSLPLNSFEVSAILNPVIWSNFWWIIFISLLLPGGIMIYQNSFEQDRWMNSEFSTYD